LSSGAVTLSEFARRIGVTRQAVTKAAKKGRIRVRKQGQNKFVIDPEEAEKAWRENRTQQPISVEKSTPKAKKGKPASGDLADQVKSHAQAHEPTEHENTYAKANATYKDYKAKIAEIEYREKTKAVSPVAGVKKNAYESGKIIKNALMNIPDRTSAMLAAETQERKIHAMLTKEINKVLEVINARLTVL
jgi:hypothetical protein